MMQTTRMFGVLGVMLMLGGGLSAAGAASAQQGRDYLIVFSAIADAAVVGENAFEVVVVDADDNPVEHAEVTAQLSMPSMTMPETPIRVNLVSIGKGWYRGVGRLTMPGRWDVTIDARSGQKRGTTQETIEATAETDGAGGAVRPHEPYSKA
jgi:nitrogen fixation protein FixH